MKMTRFANVMPRNNKVTINRLMVIQLDVILGGIQAYPIPISDYTKFLTKFGLTSTVKYLSFYETNKNE